METKICRSKKRDGTIGGCGEEKEISLFVKGKNLCKECYNDQRTKWCKENPEKVKEITAKYYRNNTDKVKEKIAKWQRENPEKVKEAVAKWRKENPEKAKEQKAKYINTYYDKNAEEINKEVLKYSTRTEFHKANTNAYKALKAKGEAFFDEICSHMPKKDFFGRIENYRNRRTILYYIKINNLWKIGLKIWESGRTPEEEILKGRYGQDIKYGNLDIKIIKYKVFEDGYYAALNEAEIKEMYEDDKYTGERILGYNKDGIIAENLLSFKETEIFTRDIYDDISYYFDDFESFGDFEIQECM